MAKNIVLFTGWSASGKTTIAKKLQKKLDAKLLGTRELIHNLAVKRGFKRIREWLSSSSAQEVLKLSRQEMLKAISESKTSDWLIIDDLFDKDIAKELKKAHPKATILILNIKTTKSHRLERLAKRLSVNESEAKKESKLIDGFKKQSGIEKVIKSADYTIKNDGDLKDSISLTYKLLSETKTP